MRNFCELIVNRIFQRVSITNLNNGKCQAFDIDKDPSGSKTDRTCTQAQSHARAHTHAHTHTHMHMHMHTHTHTLTHTPIHAIT